MMDEAKTFYNAMYADKKYAEYFCPVVHPFFNYLTWAIRRYQLYGKKFLEVGSGRGLLQDVVQDYTGFDLAETCEQYYHKPFVAGKVEELAKHFKPESFDVVFSHGMLEHVEDPTKALYAMRKVLKPGGYMIIHFAPHCGWETMPRWWKAVRLYLYRVDASLSSERWLTTKNITPNYDGLPDNDADACHWIDQVDFRQFVWAIGDELADPSFGIFHRGAHFVVKKGVR